MEYDVLIVGSGPAGTAAALGLQGSGLKIGMVDIGNDAGDQKLENNFAQTLMTPEGVLGAKHEYLESLTRNALIPKLRAPLQKYVSDNQEFSPMKGEGFNAVISHAMGGLANVWGAQMLRYDVEDLRDFPITENDLAPHYDALSDEMGLSGADDDLSRFYGRADALQPPLKLNPNADDLLSRYSRLKKPFNQSGLYIGRPRTAILTREKNGRTAHPYDGMEFFRPRSPSVYSPAYTLKRLIAEQALSYHANLIATRFTEEEGGVTLHLRDTKTGAETTMTARKLMLAAGTLNSARIVLQSRGYQNVRLPVMDNLLSYMPLINPFRLGCTQDVKTTYLQLNLCYKKRERDLVMGSFYAVNGLLHSDFLTDLPIMMHDSIRLLPHIVPAMLVLHLWHPAKADTARNHLSLDDTNTLNIHYGERLNGNIENALILKLAALGFFSLPSLVQYPLAGNSFHICGTLPMKSNPGRYETGIDGKLGQSDNIHVIDGSIFPSLSAKNLSFTIMANAHRIAKSLWRNP